MTSENGFARRTCPCALQVQQMDLKCEVPVCCRIPGHSAPARRRAHTERPAVLSPNQCGAGTGIPGGRGASPFSMGTQENCFCKRSRPGPVPGVFVSFVQLLLVLEVFGQAVAFSSRNTTYAYTAPLGASYGPIENCHTCQLPCICALFRSNPPLSCPGCCFR